MKDWRFLFRRYVLRRYQSPEPQVWKKLSRVKGRLFVDVGANVGLYSLRLSRNFRRIFAFEPNPDAVSVLNSRISGKKVHNITVFPLALSDSNGEAPFYLDSHEGIEGSVETLLPVFRYNPGSDKGAGPTHTYVGRKSVMVPVATYDSVIQETADLVKIDVEGAEFQVLKGAERALEEGRIRRIMIELHDKDAEANLCRILSEHGFSIEQLDAHPRIFGTLKRK